MTEVEVAEVAAGDVLTVHCAGDGETVRFDGESGLCPVKWKPGQTLEMGEERQRGTQGQLPGLMVAVKGGAR